ncbi:MAG: DUF4332 domain-containing protein [Phycisphaerae bacterium]
MANYKIEELEGIGPVIGEKLRGAGVTDTDGLLSAGKTKKGRRDLASNSGIGEAQILKFVNMADLFRITGVGSEYAELLEAAGVDTVPELAQRNGTNLAAKLSEVNETKKLVRTLPSEKSVNGWIAEAQRLPRVVEY